MANILLPLEQHLETLATSKPDKFADQHTNYFRRYQSLVDNLRRHVYRNINAGLSSLSKSPGLYTDHGERHFDEVVRYAGLILEGSFDSLEPFELYVLLCAIRIHDAGNIDGRDEHERRTSSILREYGGDIKNDSAELKMIADIAQAHGGHTVDKHDKDTIGALKEVAGVGPIIVKQRLIAALVRFSDEICEHYSRASTHNLNAANVIDTSMLFQLYAKSIQTASPNKLNKSFNITYSFDVALFKNKYKTPTGEEKYLIDDVLDRIDKLNHERVYTNRFLLPQMQTERIEIAMEFYSNKQLNGSDFQQIVCDSKKWSIYDQGYPSVASTWKEKDLNGVNGVNFAAKVWLS
ncbi:MAG TPA: hypothetical protein VIO56_03625 [Methylotenera sp.]